MAPIWDTQTRTPTYTHTHTLCIRTYRSKQTHNLHINAHKCHIHTVALACTWWRVAPVCVCVRVGVRVCVCDGLNEGSEEEDVMASWVFLPPGAPRESRAGPITEARMDTHSHTCMLRTQSRTPLLNLARLGEYNHYHQIQGEANIWNKENHSNSSRMQTQAHTLIYRLKEDSRDEEVFWRKTPQG